MEIQISKDIFGLYNRIVDSNLELETRQFASLNASEKNAILLETYERIFKSFWNDPERDTVFKKDSQSKCEEEESSVLKRVFPVISIGKDVSFMANLIFNFNPRQNRLEITIKTVATKSKSEQELYFQSLRQEIIQIKSNFENNCSPMCFVKAFFATLKAHFLTNITGRDAGMMYRIYTQALVHYPLFEKLSYRRQIAVMQKSIKKSMIQKPRNRDIHLYSKSTFEILTSEGLISVLANVDEYKNVYYAVHENRKTRRNPEDYSEIWESDSLVFVTYKYTVPRGDTIQTAFSADALWNILN